MALTLPHEHPLVIQCKAGLAQLGLDYGSNYFAKWLVDEFGPDVPDIDDRETCRRLWNRFNTGRE